MDAYLFPSSPETFLLSNTEISDLLVRQNEGIFVYCAWLKVGAIKMDHAVDFAFERSR